MVTGNKGWDSVAWMHLPQDRVQWQVLVNMVNKPSGSIKCGEFLDWLNDY
jgi:hypothetical protein